MCYSILAGNIIRFFLSFLNEDGVPSDPDEVTCKVGSSSLDALALNVLHDDIGKYHADWDTSPCLPGDYYCEGTGTGRVVASKEIMLKIHIGHL